MSTENNTTTPKDSPLKNISKVDSKDSKEVIPYVYLIDEKENFKYVSHRIFMSTQ